MSTERLQTVLQMTMQGADQVIGELDRVLGALAKLGEAGRTPISLLSAETVRAIDSQRPQAGSKLEELQSKQKRLAEEAVEASGKFARLKADGAADAEKVAKAERASQAAAERESAARRALTDEIYKLLPAVQERVAQEKLGAQMARDFTDQQKQRNQQRARDNESLNEAERRQRQVQLDQMRRDAEHAFGGDPRRATSASQLKAEEQEIARVRQRELARMKADAQIGFGGDPTQHRQAQEALRRADLDAVRLRQRELAQMKADAEAVFGGNPQKAAQNRAELQRIQVEEVAIRQQELRRMKAAFTDAFSQLPSENALPRGEIDAMLRKPTRQSGDTDRVYRAREVLADAEIAAATAHSRLAEAIRKAEMGEGSSQQQLRDSMNRATIARDRATRTVTDSERKLQLAIDTEALAHAKNARTSFREDFVSGFRGQRGAPFGEQIGQAFKFSVFYGTAYKVLFGLTQTLQATLQEGIQFQQAMTDLAIAADRPKEALDKIAADLGRSSTRAGFAPSQGIEIGARSLGLYGATESDQATQDRVMRISARVVNQLAVGSKQQPVDLQGNIAAIAQALGGGAASQFRIADLDAYMTKKFGIQQGSTLEAVAQSGTVGKAAGFSDQNLFAIAADMIARTGQSSSAVGGFMAQMFSRGGEGSLVNVAQGQGIDTKQNLSTVIEQLAKKYQGADPNTQQAIAAAFGRGKVQNAAVALLSDYKEVLMRSAKSNEEALGQADAQFHLRMGNIGGQLALLQGVLKDFADQLGKSGALDVLGLGIVVFRDMLEAATGLLRAWNSLSKPIRDTVIALGLLAAAGKFAAGSEMMRNRTGGIAFGRMSGPVLPGAGGINTPNGVIAQGARTVTTAEGAVVAAASRAGAGSIAKAGAAVLGLMDPIMWAIGGLLAIGALKNSADKMAEAQASATDALLHPGVGYGSSSSGYLAHASELQGLATENRQATGFLMKTLTFGRADDTNQASAARLDAEAKRVAAIGNRLALQEQLRPDTADSSVFASTSTADVTAGLQALEAGGSTAAEQLKALNDVLFGTADAAKAAANAFDLNNFAEEAATPLPGAASTFLKGFKLKSSDLDPRAPMAGEGNRLVTDGAHLENQFAALLDGPEAEKRLRQGLKDMNVRSQADLNPQTAKRLAAVVGDGMAEQLLKPLGASDGTIARVQSEIDKGIAQSLLKQVRGIKAAVKGTSALSREAATTLATSAAQLSEQTLGQLAQTDTPGRVNELQGLVRSLKRIQARAGGEDIGVISELITGAQKQIAAEQISELERLRKIAQHNAKSKAEIAKRGKRFAEREIRAAIRAGDADQLAEILGQAGKWAKAIAQSILDQALKTIGEARRVAQELAEYGQYIEGQVRGAGAGFRAFEADRVGARNYNTDRKRRKKDLAATQHAIDTSNSDPKGKFDTGSDSNNPLLDASKDASAKDKPTLAEINAAKAAAFATKSESGIAQAKAAIQGAKAAIAKAGNDQMAYWQAMDSLFAAQNQLTDAVEAYKHNLGALSIDMTNPLAQARLAVRDAARKLRDDRGKGADVIAQDKVDLKTAQASAEATKFSQNLQAIQTADELGRVKHTKYLAYLQHEHDRLVAIKHRTFQQQDELNQVDSLMKDAAKQMQGQFNLGDIKLPTPYQVRRYIEQASGQSARQAALSSVQSAASRTTTNNSIQMVFQGYDPNQIQKVVKDVVGKGARLTATAGRHR